MAFLELFSVALMPVVKTLLVTAVGSFLALDRVNLLGSVARHHLNNLVFYVFTPALVASSLAESITTSNIITLWFMPVNILLTFVIGSILGWILAKVTRTPNHLYGLVIGCCAAGNLGNLLLIIIPAVCKEKNSPFGDSSVCSANGEAYASLSMAVLTLPTCHTSIRARLHWLPSKIGAVYIWSYVYNIIRAYGYQTDGSSTECNKHKQNRQDQEIFSDNCTQALLCKDSSDDPGDYEQAASCPTESNPKQEKVPMSKNIKHSMKTWAEKLNLKMLFAPSTIATIVGLMIGVISPLRSLLVGSNAPLRAIESSVSFLGEPTIAAMTLIVGANLIRGLEKSGVGLCVVIGIQVVRYVALPLVGILIVKAARRLGLVGSDSLYQFVLLLQYALPSAMSVGTITQLFEVGESECSVIMLWNYALASVSLTLWTTYYMWLVS